MSGGDGKGHNSGAHSTGGVNGTSGKGGPGGHGDGTSWSSERGDGPSKVGGNGNGGGQKGNNGGNTPGRMRAPTAADIAAQYNSFGGTQITAALVSNIREDGFGGYMADIQGAIHTVASEAGSETSNTLSGFTGVPVHNGKPPSGGGNNTGSTGFTWGGGAKVDSADKAINDVNQKIAEMQEQQKSILSQMNNLQEKIGNRKKYSIANVRMFQAEKNQLQVKFNLYKNNINALKGTLAELEKQKKSQDVKDAISKVNDFYKELTSKYGDKLAKEARELADDAKGKKLRNAQEAIKAFDKYKDSLNKKFSVADRNAIAKALESLNKEQMAKQLKIYGKAFGFVGEAIQWSGFFNDLAKGFKTGNWNDAIISGEKIAAGKLASVMVAVAFSAMTVNPVGILGFAAIMAVTSALITDERLNKVNNFIRTL
ncbi:TPA: hypothetical protein JD320_002142 [Citrobacter koseri]|uniref:colicin-like pore-forming protein n=1 Tax=Citrobacter koseri TaxID=545 RepID=UPI001A2283A4|nr:hypothetical protein [Citrobacter koseri]HDQ2604878.1 hypothetical protein [Citrobacter koseri]